MSPSIRILLIGLPALVASLSSAAQAVPGTGPAPSSDGYRSAFDGYRPFAPGEVQDWRKANDTVGAIGGWRSYAREIHAESRARRAQQAPEAAGRVQQRAPGTADPHAGHAR